MISFGVPAGAHVLKSRRKIDEHHREAPAEHVVDGGRRALVRDVAASMPLAPTLISLTTLWFSAVWRYWPMMRVIESVPLPAANGTTMVIGLLG
jgi:hypothetical protein